MSVQAPAPTIDVPAIRSKATISWILYDLANTIFSLNIVSLYFSLWVIEMGGTDATYGNANAFSMLLMFLTAPAIGALSDMGKRRMPFLVVSTLLCVAFTFLLGQGGLTTSLAFFIIANYFYQAGLIFYDALLPVVSTEDNRGRVSGIGVGVGYVGSFMGLGVGSLLLANNEGAYASVFQATALLFLIFAIPAFIFIKERPRKDARPLNLEAIKDAFHSVRENLRRTANYPSLRRFLIGRIFYTDAANTVIAFMGIYVTQELGFTEGGAQAVLAVGIAAAVIGGFIWGPIVDRIGPQRTLQGVLVMWMATLLFAAVIPVIDLPPFLFYLAAMLAGIALGGTWSADRPLMLRLSPPRYLGQFYGIYAMVGRFASIIGPFTWGFVVTTLGLGRPVAILTLFGFVLIAFVILRGVNDEVRDWPPEDLVPV